MLYWLFFSPSLFFCHWSKVAGSDSLYHLLTHWPVCGPLVYAFLSFRSPDHLALGIVCTVLNRNGDSRATPFFLSDGSLIASVVLLIMPMTCFLILLIWNQSTLLPQDPGGLHFTSTHSSLSVHQLTDYYMPNCSWPECCWEVKQQTWLGHRKGRMWWRREYWYWVEKGHLGEGESWASCLFNIFILISALGTQRRIHPENWIISLRRAEHTQGCAVCKRVCRCVRGKEMYEGEWFLFRGYMYPVYFKSPDFLTWGY